MFSNKVVIVTGASAGIGAATAECFAKEGATLAIVGRNEAKLKDVATKCEKLGAKVLIIRADVSKDEEAKTIVKQTVDKFGRLNVLVNNAGVLRQASLMDDNILEVYDEIMNTNLRSAIHITKSAAPHLKASKGNIVNVSSIGGSKVSFQGLSIYCISKAGVDHFTKAAAYELAPFGVRVNSVNPGPVDTQMIRTALDLPVDSPAVPAADMTPLGRMSNPEEVGDLIMYLASDKAKGVTGSSYVIDNGVLLK